MYKILFVIIFPILLSGSNLVYSLQVATFSKLKQAKTFQAVRAKNIKTFLYKTDSGYWTVRFGQEKTRKDIIKIRKKSKNPILKKALVVPTSTKKIQKDEPIKKVKIKKLETPTLDFPVASKVDEVNTFTFNIRVGDRIYIIQFGKSPFNEQANKIFHEKPTISKINTVTLSNQEKILFFAKLQEIEKSVNEIEKTILPILNRSRTDKNIRAKIYRFK